MWGLCPDTMEEHIKRWMVDCGTENRAAEVGLCDTGGFHFDMIRSIFYHQYVTFSILILRTYEAGLGVNKHIQYQLVQRTQ